MRNNIHKRATAADAKHAGALSLFYKAAEELEAAAAEHDAIAEEAKAKADEYDVRRVESVASANAARTAASRLRELTNN
jgi:hypothetical protein